MISIGNLKIVESGSVAANLTKWYIRKFDEEEFRTLFKEAIFNNFLEEYGDHLNDMVFAGFGKSALEDEWSGTPEPLEKWQYYHKILLSLNLFFKFPVFILHEFEPSTDPPTFMDFSLAPMSVSDFTKPYYTSNTSYLFSYNDEGGMRTYNWQNELPAKDLARVEQFTSKFNQYIRDSGNKGKKNIRIVIDRFYDSIKDFANSQNLDDACCKCIRGLEVLYLENEMGDKKSPLAERVAMMTHPEETNWDKYMSECKRKVKNLYGKRNNIEHKGKVKVFELDDFIELREYLRKSILCFVSLRVELGNDEIYKFLKDPLSSENRAAIRQYREFLLATNGEN